MLLTGAGASLEVATCALAEGTFATSAASLAAGTPTVVYGLGNATAAAIAAGTLTLPGVAFIGGLAALWGGMCKFYYDERESVKRAFTLSMTRHVMSKERRNLDKINHEFETKMEERRSCRELLKNVHDYIKCQLGI